MSGLVTYYSNCRELPDLSDDAVARRARSLVREVRFRDLPMNHPRTEQRDKYLAELKRRGIMLNFQPSNPREISVAKPVLEGGPHSDYHNASGARRHTGD